MEVASGVFAVVSLGIQLAESVQKIREVLRGVKEAPEELQRLITKIDLLYGIFQSVNTLIERQRDMSSHHALIPLFAIALEACAMNVARLESEIVHLRELSNRPKGSLRSRHCLGLVLRKSTVDGLCSIIDEDVQHLNSILLLNANQHLLEILRPMQRLENPTQALINESTAELSTSNDGQHTLVVQARKTEATNGLSMIRNRPSTSKSSKSVRHSNWTRMWGYIQILEEVEYIRRGSEHEEQITKHQWSTTFTLPYLQCFLGWQLLRSYGQVSRSLRYLPRLVNPEFFESLILYDGSGAVKTLQDAFTRRELSPFAVDEKGRTLLHYAARNLNPAVCSMLVGLRVNPEQTDVYGHSPFADLCTIVGFESAGCAWADGQYLDTVRSLVDPPNCQFEFSAMDVETFNEWYMGPPEVAEFVLSHSMSLSEMSDYQDFAMTPLHLALRCWRESSGDETHNYAERWLYLVRKLLRGTVDLHAECQVTGWGGICVGHEPFLETPLKLLLLYPFDGEDAAKIWLALLHETGYDIVAYLTQEMFLHARDEFTLFDPWHQIPAGTRCFHALSSDPAKIILVHLDPPRVWWDWYIEPECKAYHVLHEFRNFNIHHETFRLSWSDSWPFYYPNWDEQYLLCRGPIAWEQRSRMARIRFARRTTRKLPRSQRRRAPPVPGAWIE